MPFRKQSPVIKQFVLEETDEAYGVTSPATSVSIRQATQAQHEKRANLFANIVRELGKNDEMVRLIQRFSFEELKRIEVMLTLADCNIENEDGGKLFAFDKDGYIRDESAFIRAWGSLPPLIASEIHSKVLEVNMDWAPTSGE
jgi:hypothetical protein